MVEFLLVLIGLWLGLGLLVLLVVGLAALLGRPSRGLEKRLERLEQRLEVLERLSGGEGQPVIALPAPSAPEPEAVEIMTLAPAPAPAPQLPPVVADAGWRGIERGIENWTGRLGAAAVVAGVTFLLISTAYRLDPFQRFLLTQTIAAALGGLSMWMARQSSWRELSQWIRAAAGAIALLGCAAAGSLPGLGLRWLEQTAPALALLLAGIGLNLLLAWTARRQVFAAFHGALCLLPLLIVPPSAMAILLASLIALIGLALSWRRRWDGQLLAVTASAALFQLIWYSRTGLPFWNEVLAPVGYGSAVVVAAAGILAVHLLARPGAFGALLAALLIQAGGLALALLLYPQHPITRALGCLLAGLLALVLARRAGRQGIAWLRRADVLVAQSLALLALFSLGPLFANGLLLLTAAFAEALLFLRLTQRWGDVRLRGVGRVLVIAIGVLLALLGLIPSIGPLAWQNALTLLVAAALATAAALDLRTATSMPSLGWLAGGLSLSAAVQAMPLERMEVTALLGTGVLLLVARRWRPRGVLRGVGGAVLVIHGMAWLNWLDRAPWLPETLLPHVLPLIALALLAMVCGGEGRLRQVALVLVTIDLALMALLLLEPVSALLPPVAWLLLVLGCLEAANRWAAPASRTLVWLALVLLAAVALASPGMILQVPAVVGPIRARILVELLGVAVLARWWWLQPRQHLQALRIWRCSQAWMPELVLLATLVILRTELAPAWRVPAWPAVALLLLWIGPRAAQDPRSALYAIPLHWIGLLNTALTSSPFTPVAIGLQLAFLFLVRARWPVVPAGATAPTRMQGGVRSRWGTALLRRRLYSVDDAFVAGVALTLAWRFESALLTLLWAALAVTIFTLSALFRQNQLRYVALGGLAVCLFRLLTVDLAQADLGLKGVTFIGMGVLMLTMNALYNRYRSRFD